MFKQPIINDKIFNAMLKKTIFFLIVLFPIYGFYRMPTESALCKAIREYSKKKRTLRKYDYSEIIVDSTTYSDYYLFQFFPSNQKKLLIMDNIYFPNCIDSINTHKLIWYDEKCSNKDIVIKELNKIGMIDSFYVRPRTLKNDAQKIDSIEYPTYEIDEKMTPYNVVIGKRDLQIIVSSFKIKRLEKI